MSEVDVSRDAGGDVPVGCRHTGITDQKSTDGRDRWI